MRQPGSANRTRLALRKLALILLVAVSCSFTACADEPADSGSCPIGYARDGERVCRAGGSPSSVSPINVDATNFDTNSATDIGEADDTFNLDDGTPRACLRFVGDVEITEVFANPEGSDGGFEFVELLVSNDHEGDVWLEALNGEDADPYWRMEIPIRNRELPGTEPTAEVLRRFVVGRVQMLGGVPLDCSLSGGCIQNGPDRLRVVTCEQELLDEIQYPTMASGTSYAMCELSDQPDSGQFSFAEQSPGIAASQFETNSFCQAPCTSPIGFDAWIEQIYVNPEGADGGYEFVVIRTNPGIELTNLEILGFDGDKGNTWLGPNTFAAIEEVDGRIILGGPEVKTSNGPLGTSLQNGPDGLQLISCGDVVIDEVTWGDAPSLHITEPRIPRPLDDELWIRCNENDWWSLLIGKGSGPIDEVQRRELCEEAEIVFVAAE